MATSRTQIIFDVTPEISRLIDQRAKQEGISKSEYLRGCVFLEFATSGDLEAGKFLAKKVGTRIKEIVRYRLESLDVEAVAQKLQA